MEPCPPLAIWAPTRWAAPDSSKMSSIVHHQDEALVVVGPRADAVGFEKLVKAGLKCLGVHLEAERLGERPEKGRMRRAAFGEVTMSVWPTNSPWVGQVTAPRTPERATDQQPSPTWRKTETSGWRMATSSVAE